MYSKEIVTNDYSIINYMDKEELKKLYNKPANLRLKHIALALSE